MIAGVEFFCRVLGRTELSQIEEPTTNAFSDVTVDDLAQRKSLSNGIFFPVRTADYDVNYAYHVYPVLQLFGSAGTNNYHRYDFKSSLIVVDYDHRLAH